MATGLEKIRLVFIPSPKKSDAKESSTYCTIALISYASKVMLKILEAGLQQYVNQELLTEQAGFRKGRGNRSNRQHSLDYRESKGIPKKKIYFCFIDYVKTFDCVDHNKLENS